MEDQLLVVALDLGLSTIAMWPSSCSMAVRCVLLWWCVRRRCHSNTHLVKLVCSSPLAIPITILGLDETSHRFPMWLRLQLLLFVELELELEMVAMLAHRWLETDESQGLALAGACVSQLSCVHCLGLCLEACSPSRELGELLGQVSIVDFAPNLDRVAPLLDHHHNHRTHPW
jgi:hypothetical protein